MTVRMHAGRHALDDVHGLLAWYDQHVKQGPSYYRYRSETDPDRATVEDLGIAVLFEGQPRSRAARTLVDAPIDLGGVTKRPLHETTADDRAGVVDVILELVGRQGSGFGSSLATKVLHKKRPATIPILDNQAVYATLCSDAWKPGVLPRGKTTRSRSTIGTALEIVYGIVSDSRNEYVWDGVADRWPYERIELFDMAWWAFVRRSASRPGDR